MMKGRFKLRQYGFNQLTILDYQPPYFGISEKKSSVSTMSFDQEVLFHGIDFYFSTGLPKLLCPQSTLFLV